jgi:hypothetical protein
MLSRNRARTKIVQLLFGSYHSQGISLIENYPFVRESRRAVQNVLQLMQH